MLGGCCGCRAGCGQAARVITALPRRGKRGRLPAPDSRGTLALAGFCKSPTSPWADQGPATILAGSSSRDGKQGWQQPPAMAAGTCHHPGHTPAAPWHCKGAHPSRNPAQDLLPAQALILPGMPCPATTQSCQGAIQTLTQPRSAPPAHNWF